MAENCAALEKTLRPVDAVMIVAGKVVGVGIFTTTGFITGDLPDARMIMAVWLIGGLLTLFGALSYGELGAASSPVLIPLLMGLLAAPSLASAHGVYHQVSQKEAVLVTAEYADGEPMSYAEVKVFSPAGRKIAHQTGRTDKNGCFAFAPDCQGEWKVTIDGEMGHMVEATVTVSETLLVQKEEGAGRNFSKWQGIAIGFGIIFGLTGFMYGLRVRNSRFKTSG